MSGHVGGLRIDMCDILNRCSSVTTFFLGGGMCGGREICKPDDPNPAKAVSWELRYGQCIVYLGKALRLV